MCEGSGDGCLISWLIRSPVVGGWLAVNCRGRGWNFLEQKWVQRAEEVENC